MTNQPDAPTPEFPAPQGRDEAWRQDIGFLRDAFLKLDRSFTGEAAGDGLTTWSEGPRFTLPNSRLQIKAATTQHDLAEANFEFGKTYFMDLFYAVPAGDVDVDLPVTTSFRDYSSGRDPVLETILSQ